MDTMKSSKFPSCHWRPLLCLLWFLCLATIISGAATGVNRLSAFLQPVGPFTVLPDDEIVVRLPASHSSVRNFGEEAPRIQQNFGDPLSVNHQENGFSLPSLASVAQVPNRSPKFFVINKDSNRVRTEDINAAAGSHFVAPGSQQPGIPLDAFVQTSSNNQRPSVGTNSLSVNSAQTPNPPPRFFVVQDDDDLTFNDRANSARSNSFRGNLNSDAGPNGIPLNLGNQGNDLRQQSTNSELESNARTSEPSPPFFVLHESEEVEDNLAIMSLGRRFHPNGIPIRSNPVDTPVVSENIKKTPEVESRFLLTPNSLFVLKDESIEDLQDAEIEDEKIVVNLSPMVKAHNHNTANERLSLSNDFLNQYNFVDVKGSTSFGYKTDNQYQDHTVHRSGRHEGKFGWTAPEGSQHHIEYIADEKGYRVISSSGIYLNDEDNVKAAKDNHFNEHRKALENLESIRRNKAVKNAEVPSEHHSTFGISLPGSIINEQIESLAAFPQPGFVVIESDDDIPLLHDFTDSQVPTQQNGITHKVDNTVHFPDEIVVPIHYLQDTFGEDVRTAEQPIDISDSSPTFGIPIPEISVQTEFTPVEPSNPNLFQGGSQFEITLQDPEDLVIPIVYPEETFGGVVGTNEQPITGTDSSPTFGIPIPETSIRAEGTLVKPLQPTPSKDESQFGITFEDPEDVIVPIQYAEDTFGGIAGTNEQPFAEQPIAGAGSSQTFGIPIPEIPFKAESTPVKHLQPTLTQGGNQIEIAFQAPEDIIVPIQDAEETLGVFGTAKQPFSETGNSQTFDISIPEISVKAEDTPVESLQPTLSQGESQFETAFLDPEDVIVPFQFTEETLEVSGTAKQPFSETGNSQTFGIPIPEISVKAEDTPVESLQPTPSQDEGQFGIAFQDPENINVPIQDFEKKLGVSETAEQPIFGAGSSPTFGIPIPEITVKTEGISVNSLQPTLSQGLSQFGTAFRNPEDAIVPILFTEETLGGVFETAEQSTGIAGSSPTFGIPIPHIPVEAEFTPVAPLQPTLKDNFIDIDGTDKQPIVVTDSSPVLGLSIPEILIKAEMKPSDSSHPSFSLQNPIKIIVAMQHPEGTALEVTEEAKQENTGVGSMPVFGITIPDYASNDKITSKIPAAVTVESSKLSVKTGLDKTASSLIEGFGVSIPSQSVAEDRELNPITGTGGFTVITEDSPLITFNNVRDNFIARSEGNTAGPKTPETDTFNSGSKTFSNQFFIVSPISANHGTRLFQNEPTKTADTETSDLLQGPNFSKNEDKNLIRRRS